MEKIKRFIFIESSLFLIFGAITLIEMINFNLFEKIFLFIKTPCSWFIGLSIAYAFSNLIQEGLFSLFSRKMKEEGKERGDFFFGFIITLTITSLITPYLRKLAYDLFDKYIIYFHVILIQSVVILYFLFKLKGNYKINWKYFITTEIIVIVYTLIIISFIA